MTDRAELHVRLPAELKREIARLAATECRTLQQQIVFLLQRALPALVPTPPAPEGNQTDE